MKFRLDDLSESSDLSILNRYTVLSQYNVFSDTIRRIQDDSLSRCKAMLGFKLLPYIETNLYQ